MDSTRRVIRRIMLTENARPVVYFDLDETLLHQTTSPLPGIFEEPVAIINDYTIWLRPGATEAVARAQGSGHNVHILTAGDVDHQTQVVDAVLPGFAGTVYSARPEGAGGLHPPMGRPWVLIDDLPVTSANTVVKANLLGPHIGAVIQVHPYMPARFSKIRAQMGKPQAEPEDGSVLMAAVDQLLQMDGMRAAGD